MPKLRINTISGTVLRIDYPDRSATESSVSARQIEKLKALGVAEDDEILNALGNLQATSICEQIEAIEKGGAAPAQQKRPAPAKVAQPAKKPGFFDKVKGIFN